MEDREENGMAREQKMCTKAWIVQPDDTAWDIAERFGLTVEHLSRVNKCVPEVLDLLYPGDVLLIPEDAVQRPLGWNFPVVKARLKSLAASADTDANANATFFDVFPPPKDLDEYRIKYRALLNGLRQVETSFIMPAPTGDGGMSIGPLQIGTDYHTDAWWLATQLVPAYKNCEELDYAERTVINYWLRWCPWALEFGDVETLARTHNGGPQFWQSISTRRYWRKVRSAMKKWGYHPGFPEFQYVRARNETLPLFSTNIALPMPFFGSAANSAAAMGATASLGVGTGALLAATAMEMVESHTTSSAPQEVSSAN